MAGGTMTIQMAGGAPWGFRLYGGEGDPLMVARLRKRSKAVEAGLQEGDILLAINGYNCKGMSHGTAMSLLEGAFDDLTLNILRGSTDQNAIAAALQSLGSQPVPASAIPAARPAPPQGLMSPRPQINGITNGPTEMETQVLQDGDTTRTVTTQRQTKKFGGTTLTKTTKEEVTERRSFVPARAPATQFNVPKVAATNPSSGRPGTWQPSGSGNPSDKENVAPSGPKLKFNVKKVNTAQPIGLWTPGGGLQPPAPRARTPSPPPDQVDMQAVWKPSQQPEPMQQQQYEPEPQQPYGDPYEDPYAQPQPQFVYPETEEVLPIDIAKLMFRGDSDDSIPNSPGAFSGRKKKIYADSSFYDDPEHKYPTIEEQIKMARKVALSLTSPKNQTARGHKMFYKRKERSEKWVAGEDKEGGAMDYKDYVDSEEEKYYNPNPWAPAHTWAPKLHNQLGLSQPTHDWSSAVPPPPPPVPTLPTIPIAPAIAPMDKWMAPKMIPASSGDESKKALSSEEFEKMRLYEEKVLHNRLPPQMAFSLSDDLRQHKGKGGKMFAKRRAKSEKWVVQDDSAANIRPNQDVLKRLAAQTGINPGPLSAPPAPAEPAADNFDYTKTPTKSRLAEMISRPAMSPWEAAVEGNIEKAFSHLTSTKHITDAAKSVVPPPFKFTPSRYGIGNVPKSWGPTAGMSIPPPPVNRPLDYDAPAPANLKIPMTRAVPQEPSPPRGPDPNYNNKIKGWYGGGGPQPAQFSTPLSPGGAASGMGYAPEPMAAEPAGALMSYNEAEGYSDL